MPIEEILAWLGVVVVAAPAAAVAVLGTNSLLERRISEKTINATLQVCVVTGLLAAVCVLIGMLALDRQKIRVPQLHWVNIPAYTGTETDHYHFEIKFVFDRLSVPLVILSFVLTGTIGAFASKYMHRERGYNRFFVLYSFFLMGMAVASLAGTIETLFAGWELVGLSSALLVAFFQDRPAPARNALWVWIVYRISDAALLLAAVVMHHLRNAGEGDFDQLLGEISWPDGEAPAGLEPASVLIIGLLLIVAAAGKSGLVPFSGWLPRAMEGPTPSSAVFYGALSVHLGAFLLMRISPLLATSIWLSGTVVLLGASTALLAYFCGSVQTDIKSALCYASLCQVGIIVVEIGLGFEYLALIHLLGHACVRTLQFVRAPTLLQDYRGLENAIGTRLEHVGTPVDRIRAEPARLWLYRFALERGYLDAVLRDYLVVPFARLMRLCDGLERRWTNLLAGQASRESDELKPTLATIEELT